MTRYIVIDDCPCDNVTVVEVPCRVQVRRPIVVKKQTPKVIDTFDVVDDHVLRVDVYKNKRGSVLVNKTWYK